VRVIILLSDQLESDERDWLDTAASNEAFDFLKNPEEDIYTLSDGKPLNG
jgi:hypothetical protein